MEELDLKELFNVFWNKKVHIILIVCICAVIGIIYTYGLLTPKYKASTTLLLAKAEDKNQTESVTQTDITLNQKLVTTYSELIKSKNVLRTVINNLNMNLNEEQLKKNITVNSVKDTEIIKISVVGEDKNTVATIANEIAKVFKTKIAEEIYNINNVYVIDEAETPTVPSNINHIKDILVFIFIGLVIASVYVLIANMLDTTIKSTEDVEKYIGLPVLASIPEYDWEEKGGNK